MSALQCCFNDYLAISPKDCSTYYTLLCLLCLLCMCCVRFTPVLPALPGCILHLDGCCYLANSRQLQQHLTALTEADIIISSSSRWPAVISFASADGQALLASPEQCRELQQQLQVLSTALQEQVQQWQQQQQADNVAAAGHAGPLQRSVQQQHSVSIGISRSSSSSGSNSSLMPVLDLGRVQGLPAMPTLIGFLLGYPAVYWVKSLQEAAAASKVLSTSRLRLHRVHGSCSALAHCGCDTSSGGIKGRHMTLLSFTVPEALCGDVIQSKVQQLVARLREAAGSIAHPVEAGCTASQRHEWMNIKLVLSEVDAQPVSL
jgi:hypothetical protein